MELKEEEQQLALLNFWGNTPKDEEVYHASQGIKSTKSFHHSPRGLSLFSRSWEPLPPSHPRALIFMLHGYGNDISWTFQSTAIFLARSGFSCFALDLPGHGRSQGLRAFVPDINAIVDDCISYFDSIQRCPQYRDLPCYLFGESMGGAICLLIHLHHLTTRRWNGAILVAPMCKISDNIRPRWPIPQILIFVAKFLPMLPIIPTADLLEKSVKVKEKRFIAASNPLRYQGRPRLGTVSELLRATDNLSSRLSNVSLPFIVLHGSADVITDPSVSQMLYDVARSKDKTIKIYEDMMHSLLFGETDDNVAIVQDDILTWLNHRCPDPDIPLSS